MQNSLAQTHHLSSPYAGLASAWHVQGQGLPVVILPGAHVHRNNLDTVLRQWSTHYQLLLPIAPTAAPEAAWLDSMVNDFKERHLQHPLHLIGLYEGASLACQLAEQLPNLSGLVLLNDQRHGCNRSITAPSPDDLKSSSHKLPSHVSTLSVWLSSPNATSPADATQALTPQHAKHEWMELPNTASAHTIALFIHSWMQSHR